MFEDDFGLKRKSTLFFAGVRTDRCKTRRNTKRNKYREKERRNKRKEIKIDRKNVPHLKPNYA